LKPRVDAQHLPWVTPPRHVLNPEEPVKFSFSCRGHLDDASWMSTISRIAPTGARLMTDTLFPVDPPPPGSKPALHCGVPRVQYPVRNQVEMQMADLDSLIDENHTVRAIWAYMQEADLSELYAEIQAVEGAAGRPAIDPKILLALWMYATADGIGSARKLAKLCEDHHAYRWICGGVSVNYHTLADFRSQCEGLIDGLLTTHVAALQMAGVLTLKRVAHDGLRVRASAGSGSFKKLETLQEHYTEAKAQVAALRKELDDDPAACDRRHKAARERAVREREERVAAALRQYPEVHAHKKKDKDQTRPRFDDRSRCAKDEDARRRIPAGVQRSIERGCGQPVDRGRRAPSERQ
jgi:transposase